MPDRLEAAARAAPFTEFAVDPHPGADEQGNGGGESRDECDQADALAGALAELVGHEQAGTHADGHFRGGRQ